MKLLSSNVVETNRVCLEISVDGETFENALSKIFKREAKKIAVKGFRKGKAPRSVIEKVYGKEVFYEDAMKEIYPEALDEAIKEQGLNVIEDKIDLEVIEVGENGFTFKATVTTYPEVSLEDYKGIPYTKHSTEVTEELLQEEIDKVRDRNSRLVDVEDRPAQANDIAVIDFEGFKDGVPFDGGKAENYNLTLGSGQFIPGFEDQIVGHNKNDEFTINVTFPEEYQVEDLAGQPVEFKIKLHEIKYKELPELNDDFVKDVSEKDTVEEYKAELSEALANKLKAHAEEHKRDEVLTQLCDKVNADIPEAMIENKLNTILNDMKQRLQSQGLSFEVYLQYTGMTEADLRDQYRSEAEKSVKIGLALRKIVELEKLEVADEDIEKEFNEIAEQYKMDVEKVKAIIPKEGLTDNLEINKAMDVVLDSAVEK